jgi:predicted permease
MGIFADLRYGLKALAKNRFVTAVAVLSLAFGIGANIAVFTLLTAILHHPIPVHEPARLAAFYTQESSGRGFPLCSYPNFQDYRDRNSVFSSLLLYNVQSATMDGRLVVVHLVSGNYFQALGVAPVSGRAFLPQEDGAPGSAGVVVISHNLWSQQFAHDPLITSRTLQLNGRAFQVIGVAPPGFTGLQQMAAADIWAPLSMFPAIHPMPGLVRQRRALLFTAVGRLKPGVSRGQAEAGLDTVSQELQRAYPQDNRGRRIRLMSLDESALPARVRTVVSNAGSVVAIISALVLLIACANLANLLLARAAERNKEITLRLALGASRWRLVRQLLAESLLLSSLGSAVGLAFAALMRNLLWSMRPPMFKHAGFYPAIDGRVLLFTAAAAIVTGLLFGLAPALRATRADLNQDLKERTGKAGSPGRWRQRSVLVAGQMAFSVIALVGAGLFVRSIVFAGQLDTGFAASELGTVTFDLADQSSGEARGREYHRRVLEVARATPGVSAAALSKDSPFVVSSARHLLVDGRDNSADTGQAILTSVVSPGYLQTVGIPLLHGRDFADFDVPAAPRVAIVNDSAAERFWPAESAIGKRIRFAGDPAPVEVVGVARTANYRSVGEPPQPLVYLSLTQFYFGGATVYLRTRGNPAAVAADVAHAMQPIDRRFYLQPGSVAAELHESLWPQRLSAILLAAFGMLAVALAVIGIYGVIAYSVHQRVREIGVRMALGATHGSVQRMLLRQAFRWVGIGVASGLSLALIGGRWVESLLFVVRPADPITFTVAPLFLALVALVACWIPARRATRIDPATALRDE